MKNTQIVAERIKIQAKRKGVSVKKMLENCELGVNTVIKMANGTDIVSQNLLKIANYLDCSVDYLLGRTDNPNPEVDFNKSLIIYLEKYKRKPEELAVTIDVDLSTVNRWLNFEDKIPSEYILPICEFFGIAYFDFSRQAIPSGELFKIEQSPTIENSNNIEVTGFKYNTTAGRNEIDSQETTRTLIKEVEKVFDKLSPREQMKLMTIIYDYEEECKKS